MFKILNSLLNKGEKVLPVCDDYDKLSDSLADFFQDKIVKIRQSLDGLNLEVDRHIDTLTLTKRIQTSVGPRKMFIEYFANFQINHVLLKLFPHAS